MRGSQHPQSAYVGLNDSRQLPGTYVKTQYGYSQESLPTQRQGLQNVHTRKMQQLTFLSALQERTPKIQMLRIQKKGEIKDFYPDTLMQKTCFNIPLLDNLLSNYLDKQFVEYLIRGLKEGFNTGKKVEQSSLQSVKIYYHLEVNLHVHFCRQKSIKVL